MSSRLASLVAVPLAAVAAFAAFAVSASACSGGSSLTDTGDADATAAGEGGSTTDASGAVDGSKGADASDSGGNLGRVPAVHRAAAAECTHVRGAGNFDPTLMFADCKSDAECTTGTNGRCLSSMGGAQTNTCSYDGCFLDSECSGKVCTCREPGGIAANRCSQGNCTVDATCGVGGYCSPSVDPDKTNYGITGWWCHTAADSCIDDADCATDGGPSAKCAYDPKATHWSCSSEQFLPP
jgi:hypothetical protein